MATEFFDSKVSVFKITDVGSSLRDISPSIVGIDGLPGSRKLYPATALGSSGDRWSPGLVGAKITLELMYTDTALVGIDTIFVDLWDHTAPTAFEYFPAGGATPKYSGNCWVESFVIHTRVNNLVMATVVLATDNGITSA